MSDQPPEAVARPPSRFHFIWLVPVAAAILAIYLGWETLAARGPMITITFANGQGIVAGQTKIEHNAVMLGTVQHVQLSDDFKQVVANVRMDKAASGLLTSNARFWVVRPSLSLTDISGLQTLVSGSFIAVDPGPTGGSPQLSFRGLDQPPGVTSDQPGKIFTLHAPTLGWLEDGAPVFYHNITVGHLLDFQDTGMGQPVLLHIFVKAPYDQYVRSETHFWNSSGLTASLGPSGVHVAIESVQALVAGGIDFDNFNDATHLPPPPPNQTFQLFGSFDEAQNAGFQNNIRFVTYFNQSVAGLVPGSPVLLYGIRVGTVRSTHLLIDPETGQPRVRVAFDVQPARVFAPSEEPKTDPLQETQRMVDRGLRARVDTGNLLTGQEVIGIDSVPDPTPVTVGKEGDRIVWPSQNGGFQDLTDSLHGILVKLNKMPLDKLGANADDLIVSLRTLSDTASNTLKPLATQLPIVSRQLQDVLHNADRLMASLQSGYGANSDTHQNLQQIAAEAAKALRSVQDLTTYLNDHPGSVLWGRP